MTPERITRITTTICLLASVIELLLLIATTTQLVFEDTLIALFFIGPYMLFAWLAQLQPQISYRSWVLLVIGFGISAWGIVAFAWHTFRFHTEPDYRLLQYMDGYVVAIIQWGVVLSVGIVLCICCFKNDKGKKIPRQKN